ncbi:MAG: phosphopantetheine-binding protein [Deltaproteobacteria bacterium]|nr:phosphopantetheine-binding protein [Deltaproteobacteria bacterium]
MDILAESTKILADILDIEGREITPETYLIRELGAESIDLLELSVAINSRFNIEVNDDELFLRTLRLHLRTAAGEGRDAVGYLAEKYPALTVVRIAEILADMGGGPVLRVKDILSYVAWHGKN